LPSPGWVADAGWEEELIPLAEMPHVENPLQGFIATANSKPQLNGEDPFLGVDWLDGYRAEIATESLANRTDWDVPATMALQMSQQNLHWREVRAVMLKIPAEDPLTRAGLRLLEEWDGSMTADSPAAAIYSLFMAEMSQRVVRSRAPK